MKCCDYCDPNYEDDLIEKTAQIQKYGDTYCLISKINGTEYSIPIEHCHMCGRRLTEEE